MKPESIKDIRRAQLRLLEIVFCAVLLGVATSIIANSVTAFPLMTDGIDLLLGCVLLFFVCLYLAVVLSHARHRAVSFHGFVLCEVKSKQILEVSRYKYSEELAKNFRAAFVENPALHTIWCKEIPGPGLKLIKGNRAIQQKPPLSNALLVEATEYFLLDQLSLHLDSYFRSSEVDISQIATFERQDVPDILLKNRFLELFSRPMSHRTLFVDQADDEKDVVASYTQEGAIYERFELDLPVGSTLRRTSDDQIEIGTRRFRIRLKAEFDGYASTIDPKFLELYLHQRWDTVAAYSVSLNIEIQFHIRSFLSATGWRVHGWADSFLAELEESTSRTRFFDRIGWEAALTFCQIKDSMRKSPRGAAKSKPTSSNKR